ncbi:MAG: hypothetical protein OSA97_17000 [Nevskia sp.]|nr:hypothetical protein [Nevskia sp.]
MKYSLLALLFIVAAALAEDFDARAKAGQQALASAEGQAYEHSLGLAFHKAISACIPKGSTLPANLGKFTFVANVASSGLASSVEVRPGTAVSHCFAEQLDGAQLPPPPAPPHAGSLFPVTDEIEVVP